MHGSRIRHIAFRRDNWPEVVGAVSDELHCKSDHLLPTCTLSHLAVPICMLESLLDFLNGDLVNILATSAIPAFQITNGEAIILKKKKGGGGENTRRKKKKDKRKGWRVKKRKR